MKSNNFWGTSRSSGVNVGMIVRLGLALVATAGSLMLAWTLLSGHHNARASSTINEINTTTGTPWGIALDSHGNAWVAEPNCQPTPPAGACVLPTGPGAIDEITLSGGILTKKAFSAPAGINPTFLAIDGGGNVWFTDPTHNAIGELPAGKPYQEFTTGFSANASPYDLVFDKHGILWFSEINGDKIGAFNTTTHAVVKENPVPTAGSQPLGLAYDATHDVVWFAENGAKKVGSFSSASTAITIKEVAVSSPPHLITLDKTGNVWYSEGTIPQVGEIPGGTGTPKDFTACPTAPCGTTFIGGIGADGSGNIWFNDAPNDRVGTLNPGTSAVTEFALPSANGHPQDGLAVDGGNNIWSSEEFNSKVAEIPAGTTPPTPTPTSGTSPTPTGTPIPPASGPVSKNWFFGEGRIGAGFEEWLTLGNPTSNACQVNIQYLYTPDGGSPKTTALSVLVQANSRQTQSVNSDLGIAPTGTGNSVSTTVSVDNAVTPNCTGIVAERPIYNTTFGNPLNTNSGTDVIGATHTGKTFYFADVRTGAQTSGGSVSSFIPVENPGSTLANVTATYFVGGKQVSSQTVAVAPGTRGTILPDTASLPARVAVQVSSDQPVLVERPSYFFNVVAGNAGTTSGDADVVGVQNPTNDFLFAEGYTGGAFQEYLVLANFNPTTDITNASLALEYDTGASYSFSVNIPHLDQTTLDINQMTANPGSLGGTCTTTATTCATSPNVSIEVKAPSGSNFVAEREMFFHYNHVANYGRSLQAQGVSDVIGQGGPAAATSYSFAEGYTNAGWDEWLTLQNPTSSPETITITLANEKGRIYTLQVTVRADTRYTVDVTGTVIQNLYQAGDGYQGYEVSMAVQSSGGAFVAERPMYFNASGFQGGDVQIGYTGG